MNTQDMIAQFLAKGGKVTQVAAGERSMTESQVYRAIGYAPDALTVYYVAMTQETGEKVVEKVSARSMIAAEGIAMNRWPECQVNAVYTRHGYDKAKEMGIVHSYLD